MNAHPPQAIAWWQDTPALQQQDLAQAQQGLTQAQAEASPSTELVETSSPVVVVRPPAACTSRGSVRPIERAM